MARARPVRAWRVARRAHTKQERRLDEFNIPRRSASLGGRGGRRLPEPTTQEPADLGHHAADMFILAV